MIHFVSLLLRSVQTPNSNQTSSRMFQYDPLGNIVAVTDFEGPDAVLLGYESQIQTWRVRRFLRTLASVPSLL